MAPVSSRKDKTATNKHQHAAWSYEPTIFPPVLSQSIAMKYPSGMELAPSTILQTNTTSTPSHRNQTHQKRRLPELKRIDHNPTVRGVAPYIESNNRDKQLQNKVRSLNINSFRTQPQLENSSNSPNVHKAHLGNVDCRILPNRSSDPMNRTYGGNSAATPGFFNHANSVAVAGVLQSQSLYYSKCESPSTSNRNSSLIYATTDRKHINQPNSQENNSGRHGTVKNVEKFAGAHSHAQFEFIGSDQAQKTSNISNPVNRMYRENSAATQGFFDHANLIAGAGILHSHNLYYPKGESSSTRNSNPLYSQENNFGRHGTVKNVEKLAGAQSNAQRTFIRTDQAQKTSNIPQLAEQFSTQLVQEYLNYLIRNGHQCHVLQAQTFLTLKYPGLKGLANSSNSFSLNELAKIMLTTQNMPSNIIPEDTPSAVRASINSSLSFNQNILPIPQAYEILQNLHHGQYFAGGPVIPGKRQNMTANTASFSTQHSSNLQNSIKISQNSTFPTKNVQHDMTEPAPPVVETSHILGNHCINQRSPLYGVMKISVQQKYNNSALRIPYSVPRHTSNVLTTALSPPQKQVDMTDESQNILENKIRITTNEPTQSNEQTRETQISVTDARGTQIPVTDTRGTPIPVTDACGTQIPLIDTCQTQISVTDTRGTQIPVTDARGTQIPVSDARGTQIPVTDARETQISVTDARGTQIPVTDAREWNIPVTNARGTQISVSDARGTQIPVIDARGTHIPVTDARESKILVTNARGTQISVSDARGTQIPVIDARGTQIPVTEARGTQIPVTDAHGTQIPVSDARGTQIPVIDVRGTHIPVTDARESKILVTNARGTQNSVTASRGTQIPVTDATGTQIPVTEINFSQKVSTRKINVDQIPAVVYENDGLLIYQNSLSTENRECKSGESLRKIFSDTSENGLELESSSNKSEIQQHSATDVSYNRLILPSTNISGAEHLLLPNKPQDADNIKITGIEMLLHPANKIALEYSSSAHKPQTKVNVRLNSIKPILPSSNISAIDQKSHVEDKIGVPILLPIYQNTKSPSEPQEEAHLVNSNEKSHIPESDTDTEEKDIQHPLLPENQSLEQEPLTEEEFLDEFTSLLCQLDSHNSSTNDLFERLQGIITKNTGTEDSLKRIFSDNLKTSDNTVSSTTSSEPV